MADLIAFVLMLMLTGVFVLLISPVVMILLWLNRKMMENYIKNSRESHKTQ